MPLWINCWQNGRSAVTSGLRGYGTKNDQRIVERYADPFILMRLIVAAPGDRETRGIHDRGAVHDATHSF